MEPTNQDSDLFYPIGDVGRDAAKLYGGSHEKHRFRFVNILKKPELNSVDNMVDAETRALLLNLCSAKDAAVIIAEAKDIEGYGVGNVVDLKEQGKLEGMTIGNTFWYFRSSIREYLAEENEERALYSLKQAGEVAAAIHGGSARKHRMRFQNLIKKPEIESHGYTVDLNTLKILVDLCRETEAVDMIKEETGSKTYVGNDVARLRRNRRIVSKRIGNTN